MKKIITICLLTILFFSGCSNGKKLVKGNTTIVDQEVTIEDYDKIKLSNTAKVIYQQDEIKSPYLLIISDQNIFEAYNIYTENGTLYIGNRDLFDVRPTELKIITNSTNLKEVSIAGSGNIICSDGIKSDHITFNVSGSGNANFEKIKCNTLTAKIAGSGNVNVKGKATKTEYEIAGSGNVNSFDLVQDSAYCSIAGSGNIKLFAKDLLKVSIAGSGNIKYKGNPTVDKNIAGSGKIKKIDE